MKNGKKVFKLTSIIAIFVLLLPLLIPFNQVVAKEDIEVKNSLLDYIQVKPYSEAYIEWLELDEEKRKNTMPPPMHEIEYKPVAKTAKSPLLRGAVMLPSAYDLRDYIDIEVKSQKETNQCWAFATASCLETNIAKTTGEVYEASPSHMEYATSKTFTDGINPLGHNRELGYGGNAYMSMSYYTRGSGPVAEPDMPFENNETMKPLSYIQGKTVEKKITEYIYFPNVKKSSGFSLDMSDFRKSVKEHIMNYGAVYAGVYYDEDYMSFDGSCLNLYCNGTELGVDIDDQMGHAVSIIGWDDNYAVENFKVGNQPQNPGAYLVRNSWGADISGSGYTGYDWISYEDYFIEYTLMGIVEVEDIDYDDIYQYDILGATTEISFPGLELDTLYGANVFSKTSGQIEILNEIGLTVDYTDINYEIYVNPQSGDKSYANLTKVKTGTETLTPGYHTIKFDTPIYLTGSEFVVVVKYISPNSEDAVMSVECQDSMFWNTAKSNVGESYIAFDIADNEWVDFKELEAYGVFMNTNLCIKAFTSGAEETVKLLSLGSVSYNPSQIHEGIGGIVTIPVNTVGIENGSILNVAIKKGSTNLTSNFTITGTTVNSNQANISIGVSSGIWQGDYTVEVGYEGAATKTKTFSVLAEQETERSLSLGSVSYNPSQIREGTGGTVTIPVSTIGIGNGSTLNVAVKKGSTTLTSSFTITGTTVNSNQASISVAVPSTIGQGDYTVEVGYIGVATQSKTFSVLAAEEPSVIKGSAVITVKNSSGATMQGVTVKVYEDNVKRSTDLTTDANGEATIANMIKGKTYKIDVAKDGYVEQKGIVISGITENEQVVTKEVKLAASNNTGGNSGNGNSSSGNTGSSSSSSSKGSPDDTTYDKDLPKTSGETKSTGEIIAYFGAFNGLIGAAIVSFIKMKGLIGV